MEITWNELLNSSSDKKVEILATLYAEIREFKKYQILLMQASKERAKEKLKSTSTSNE